MTKHFTQFLSNFNTIFYKIRLQYNLILLYYSQFIFKSPGIRFSRGSVVKISDLSLF